MFAQAGISGDFPGSNRLHTRWCSALLALSLCLLQAPAWAGHPGVVKLEDAHTWRTKNRDFLKAQFAIELSSGARKAVKNGVLLVFELQIQVVEMHTWLWDDVSAEITLQRSLQYHALSQSYQVKDLEAGTQGNYQRLDDALRAVGKIDSTQLAGEPLDSGPNYSVRLRGSLDVESLPTPLRLFAYVSSDWSMVSKWYKWPLVR